MRRKKVPFIFTNLYPKGGWKMQTFTSVFKINTVCGFRQTHCIWADVLRIVRCSLKNKPAKAPTYDPFKLNKCRACVCGSSAASEHAGDSPAFILPGYNTPQLLYQFTEAGLYIHTLYFNKLMLRG